MYLQLAQMLCVDTDFGGTQMPPCHQASVPADAGTQPTARAARTGPTDTAADPASSSQPHHATVAVDTLQKGIGAPGLFHSPQQSHAATDTGADQPQQAPQSAAPAIYMDATQAIDPALAVESTHEPPLLPLGWQVADPVQQEFQTEEADSPTAAFAGNELAECDDGDDRTACHRGQEAPADQTPAEIAPPDEDPQPMDSEAQEPLQFPKTNSSPSSHQGVPRLSLAAALSTPSREAAAHVDGEHGHAGEQQPRTQEATAEAAVMDASLNEEDMDEASDEVEQQESLGGEAVPRTSLLAQDAGEQGGLVGRVDMIRSAGVTEDRAHQPPNNVSVVLGDVSNQLHPVSQEHAVMGGGGSNEMAAWGSFKAAALPPADAPVAEHHSSFSFASALPGAGSSCCAVFPTQALLPAMLIPGSGGDVEAEQQTSME